MKQYIADANIVLRNILNDIPKQADEVERYFLKAASGEIIMTIPVIVFVELVYVLYKQYRLGRTDIQTRLTVVAQMPHLDVENRHIILEALSTWAKTTVSFIDCLLLSVANDTRKELLTFDKRLQRLSKKLVKDAR